MADVTFVPERNVFECGEAVRPYQPGQTAQVLRGDRIPLMGHGRRTLLSLGKKLLHFKDLGSLKMSKLYRKLLKGGGQDRQGGKIFG
jgi:hypothetical protein